MKTRGFDASYLCSLLLTATPDSIRLGKVLRPVLTAMLLTACAHQGPQAQPAGAPAPRAQKKSLFSPLTSGGKVCLSVGSPTVTITSLGATNRPNNCTIKITPPAGHTAGSGPYALTLFYKHATNSAYDCSFVKTYTVPAGSYPKLFPVTVNYTIPGSHSGNYSVTGTTSVGFSDDPVLVPSETCLIIMNMDRTARAAEKKQER